MSTLPIYLDHQATTPADPRVVEAMLPYFCARVGNPASRTHRHGWEAETAVDAARAEVARAVGGDTVVFTSGATEAINLALFGRFEAELRGSGKRRRIVTQVTEHKAVLDVVDELERRGAEVVRLPVDADGRVSLEASGAGGLCGGASIYPGSVFNSLSLAAPVSPHCSGCQDVPLQLEDFVAKGRQRIAASFQVSPLPYQATLTSTRQNQKPISAPPVRAQRTSVQRSTVLRI